MAAALTRLSILCLALVFVLGTGIEPAPCGIAQTELSVSTGMPAGGSGTKAPCIGDAPSCIGHCGCPSASALPISPPAAAVALLVTAVAYDFAAAALSGLSVEPELAPPILKV